MGQQMIRVNTMSNKAIKMLKAKANREHRKFHIEKAEQMREQAKEWLASAIEYCIASGFDAKEEINVAYNDMMLEAIAEENRKCMDRKH
jgi:rRNA processing protein Krr1/Pno1